MPTAAKRKRTVHGVAAKRLLRVLAHLVPSLRRVMLTTRFGLREKSIPSGSTAHDQTRLPVVGGVPALEGAPSSVVCNELLVFHQIARLEALQVDAAHGLLSLCCS